MDQISLHTRELYKQLKEDIRSSSTIYILSSFLMHSGVEVIYEDLAFALKNHADVKVLTGDYLYITQPEALHKLLCLPHRENFELRLWRSEGVSFHPKSYIFKHQEEGAIIIGSSNLSRSALTSGIEWNLRMQRNASEKTFDQAIHYFISLFYAEETMAINHETIKRYEKDYDQFYIDHADLRQTWTSREEKELTLSPTIEESDLFMTQDSPTPYEKEIRPRQAQIEALQALEDTIAEEYSKAMVVMATGLGKTYLAAFLAKNFKKILFIAHREEIIKQAKESFEKVLDKSGGLFYGLEKDTSHDMIFASIFTLSIQDHLKQFSKDEFDLIIIDEFHHAAAKSYERVIDYFNPTFMLGLTATPERTDGQDIFSICDGNVAYEITFIEAIRRGWLSPFKYIGIKDDIDYSKIRWLGQRYDQQQLLIEQLNEQRANYIFENWDKYKQTRTLAFCSSIEQADYLASFFKENGAKALSLTSETVGISRDEAIRRLEAREIDIIFTVDLFNEGVDIPLVDTLLFARPTESMVVFTQQIGRGLRKAAGKEKCVIIDLIGNYRSADMKLEVFHDPKIEKKPQDVLPIVPAMCEIEIETEVIDLLKELRKKRSPRRERIYHDYLTVKEEIGRRPTYVELHKMGKMNSKEYRQAFGGYFAFLKEYGELSEAEKNVYNKHYQWLQKLERERMTKSYKMVVLKYMLEKGPRKWHEPVTPNEVAPYFHRFYMEKEYRKKKDFSNQNTKRLWDYDEERVAKLIADMPMSKWVDGTGLISFDGKTFTIEFSIEKEEEEILHQMTEQICTYRLFAYFRK